MRIVFIMSNIFLIIILLASCGGYDSLGISDNSSKEAKRYEVLRALDRGDYDYVISALEEDPTYGGAFTEEEGKLNLAAAYLGKAGYDYVEIVNELIDAEEDPSKSLIKAFARRASGKTIASLDKVLELYNEIKPENCTTAQTFYEKEACFYYGLVSSVQATTGLSLAIGGLTSDNTSNIAEAVEYWLSANETNLSANETCSIDVNQNGIPDGADISACAIEFGTKFNGTEPSSYNCTNNATVVYKGNVTFTKDNKDFDFIYVEITVAAGESCSENKTDKILMTETNGTYTPVITDGYCNETFDRCTPTNETTTSCYPCPVIVEDEDKNNVLDMNEVILDAINNVDTLTEVIGEESEEGEQSELSNQLLEIKKDICEANPEACLCGKDRCDNNTLDNATDIQITNSTVIIDYLLSQQ